MIGEQLGEEVKVACHGVATAGAWSTSGTGSSCTNTTRVLDVADPDFVAADGGSVLVFDPEMTLVSSSSQLPLPWGMVCLVRLGWSTNDEGEGENRLSARRS